MRIAGSRRVNSIVNCQTIALQTERLVFDNNASSDVDDGAEIDQRYQQLRAVEM